MADAVQVKAPGLKEFRRQVRRFDKEAGKEFQRELRQLAREIVSDVEAPRASGTLAGSYRGTARGATAIIRSPLPYARFIEFGFHPRGGDTFVEGTNPVGRAVEQNEAKIIDGLGDAVDRTAVRLGWR